ncbi:uncharacterized protein B0I36DRAFT_325941 [Microdochium trichocladiopsis]|uniref:Uncharacterized protein n=1 Tax=Microdochium trichocladiopsis TaxID=1682393 RepID=A0A9P8Y4E4_9PEZI|nr:uncharacterized protein B0I36DRAFT_325941 [Microdochium trichocladiopsis]KAH7029523.1 hypothetical protein B0I36DRAFT_325941 [Microdochium trichocladiopsis]
MDGERQTDRAEEEEGKGSGQGAALRVCRVQAQHMAGTKRNGAMAKAGRMQGGEREPGGVARRRGTFRRISPRTGAWFREVCVLWRAGQGHVGPLPRDTLSAPHDGHHSRVLVIGSSLVAQHWSATNKRHPGGY